MKQFIMAKHSLLSLRICWHRPVIVSLIMINILSWIPSPFRSEKQMQTLLHDQSSSNRVSCWWPYILFIFTFIFISFYKNYCQSFNSFKKCIYSWYVIQSLALLRSRILCSRLNVSTALLLFFKFSNYYLLSI